MSSTPGDPPSHDATTVTVRVAMAQAVKNDCVCRVEHFNAGPAVQPMDRTAMSPPVQPTWHWFAGRFCPGTRATSGAPGRGRRGELHPSGVDVELHGHRGTGGDQCRRQVGRHRVHAGGVQQVTLGVLAEGAAGDARPAPERGPPREDGADLGAGLPAVNEGEEGSGGR